MAKRSGPTESAIDKIIRKNLGKLTRPGVLTVRPGYEIANEQLSGRSAIVATVHTKKPKASLSKKEALPETIDGVPVDVREASAHQRLRAHDPAAAELTQTYGRPETIDPEWPYERELPSGNLLSSKTSHTQQLLAVRKSVQPAATQALSSHAKKTALPYAPPGGVSLKPVTTNARVICNVSPDDGLKTLRTFLSGTQHSLVVGMYDFTSGTILKEFEAALGAGKTLQMVLDNPAPNQTRDQTDTETVEELDKTLGDRANIVRALDRSDVFASAWMFPYAYHIKVIVRDGTSVWLSSGNLNNSNQPNPAIPPKTEDRDWHIVIDDAGIAATFKAFLDQDYASAKDHQADNLETQRAVQDALAKLAAEANPSPAPKLGAAATPVVFPAHTFVDANVTVTPLFTPDTLPDDAKRGQYLSNILRLINGAEESIHIQLQYIEASKGSGNYDTLLRAIAAKVRKGVEVKLIESAEYGLKWAEKMKSSGVDLTANIWLQPNVHNKGFVIDSKIAVVSSQNFSPAGVEQNRDAGVILESEALAQWYGQVFTHDLENLAKPFVKPDAVARKPANTVKSTKAVRATGAKASAGKARKTTAAKSVKAKTDKTQDSKTKTADKARAGTVARKRRASSKLAA
ncbi:MAG TPA: phospholipase D-like domain-containing protein [Pararobbsia sp.]|nr:phospholipase D-like domain-containing protein [Pararobbsia sp.]